MNLPTWEALEAVIRAAGIKPIVSIVPDNRDPALTVQAADSTFWQRVRSWQEAGWAIGLHGHTHVYQTNDPGLLGLNRFSEFSGLPLEAQRSKVKEAVAILAAQGIVPDLWVAPGHSFDSNTLVAVKEAGIDVLNDGFAVLPATDSLGMFWVPQQLWRFRELPLGVWTVCLHHNYWGHRDIETFAKALSTFRPRVTSLGETLRNYSNRRMGVADALAATVLGSAMKVRRALSALPLRVD